MEPYAPAENYTPKDHILSKLRFYSVGIVAMNKLLSSKDIEVYVTEEYPMVDGFISEEYSDYKSKGVDNKDAAYETEMKSSVTVLATWLSMNGSNRVTAPDVRRGELVMLYQFGDVDKYYWATMREDLKLRKLETVIYAYSATRDENKDAKADTTYYFEISTHKKLIHVHTSKDDGEPYSYDIQIDTSGGKITITDDVRNFITLDSKETVIHVENTAGTFIEVNKSKINMFASDSVNMRTPMLTFSDDLVIGNDIIAGGVIASNKIMIAPSFVIGTPAFPPDSKNS